VAALGIRGERRFNECHATGTTLDRRRPQRQRIGCCASLPRQKDFRVVAIKRGKGLEITFRQPSNDVARLEAGDRTLWPGTRVRDASL